MAQKYRSLNRDCPLHSGQVYGPGQPFHLTELDGTRDGSITWDQCIDCGTRGFAIPDQDWGWIDWSDAIIMIANGVQRVFASFAEANQASRAFAKLSPELGRAFRVVAARSLKD